MEHSDHWIMTGWHRELWDFKTMKRWWNILIIGSWLDGIENCGISKQWKDDGTFWSLDHDWMARGTVGFQNNEKIMEHSDHWIMTGWHFVPGLQFKRGPQRNKGPSNFLIQDCLMDLFPNEQNFYLDKDFITAWKSITKLVIFRSFVAKCCKMRII
jgi:hypothetical protein